MTTRTVLQKLKSRKLWLALLSMCACVYLAIGGEESTAKTVLSYAGVIVSALSFNIPETIADVADIQARTKTAGETVEKTVEVIENEETGS